MIIVPGSTSEALARGVSNLSGIPVVVPCVSRFSDGEINVEVPSSELHGCGRVVLMQSLCVPSSDNIIELVLLADAIRRILPSTRIVAVIPYMGYARQDRIMYREDVQVYASALSAKAIARLLSTSCIDEIVTVDIHSSQIAGFYDVPFTSISANSVMVANLVGSHLLEKLVVVAPDYGALNRVRAFVRDLSKKCDVNSIQVAIIDKYRESPGVSEVVHVVGNVRERHCLILDDLIDSGGTICNAAAALKARGAMSVHGYVTHGVLSGKAPDTISASELDSLVITNTICNTNIANDKIRVVPMDALISEYLLSSGGLGVAKDVGKHKH